MPARRRRRFSESCRFTLPSKRNRAENASLVLPDKRIKRRRIIPWLFLAPSLIGVVWFSVVSFLDVVKRSFQDAMGGAFVGLDNYRTVLDNPPFRLAAGNTAHFLAMCIPLLMSLSFFAALLLSAGAVRAVRAEKRRAEKTGDAKSSRIYTLFRTTLVLPMTVPAASMVLVWRIFLCPEGVVNQLLTRVSGQSWDVDWAFSSRAFPVLIVTYLWKHMGYAMVLWLAGLGAIPQELYEAAKMDGAGAAASLFFITLPGLRGSFGLVGTVVLVNAFRVYREAYLLAGSYPDSSIYLLPHLFAHWFLQLDIQKITAAAVLLVVSFATPVLLVQGLKFVFRHCERVNSNYFP